MNVKIDYSEPPSQQDPKTYQFWDDHTKTHRVYVHPAPTEKMEPRITVVGAGGAGRKLELEMTLTEFRDILADVVASGVFPGLNRDDLVTAGRVIGACLDAIREPSRLGEG
jgi:hypothetical protein